MSTISTSLHGNVAVILLNNPPLNMGNTALRSDLAGALRDLGTRPEIGGVVIASALTHFYAGSDISEFSGELAEPQLPAVIEIIEKLDVPVIAAITGLALGGGLELALACDGRIGDSSVVVGFPEVTLGMLPGAGGTVRTPRLTGVATAVDLVASARQVAAEEALRIGLLDEIVSAELLLDRAIELAASGWKRRVVDGAVPHDSVEEIATVVERVSRRARPNIVEAIELVRNAGVGDVRAALATERKAFHRLRSSDEAGNLRYLFFARRAAAKALRSKAQPLAVHTVGIAGAGTMGASLAKAFSAQNISVIVFDRNTEALARLDTDGGAIHTATEISELAAADLVIDAVFEDMAVKQALLDELEPIIRPDAIVVSNTSYLDLRKIAEALEIRSRFAGLHFFNPPHRNPLVEVIRTPDTDESTVASLAKIAALLSKVAIPAGIGDGFVANRVYADYRMQAEFLVEEGASPHGVDLAMRELGMPMGPFAVADMSGLDIAWARRKRLAADRDPHQRYVTIPDLLCEAGRLGQKTGAGWYAYPNGSRRGEADPVVDEIIAGARTEAGVQPRSISVTEIQDRVLASMLCAAASLVESGVAERASDIDVAMTEGFAFPRALGGPIRHMSRRDQNDVIAALAAVYASCPVTFALAEPATRGVLPDSVRRCLTEVCER